ncbi:hypothetical protein [Metabacillus fastidiosus]|uniref:hypothetical protein n=1 Tax=Metabacillus fastidiosus TaxID=1458 RepID=UPI003D287148
MGLQLEKEDYMNTISTVEDSLVSYYERYLYSQYSEEVILREFDCWQGRADLISAKIIGEFSLNFEQAKRISNLTNAQIISLLHYKAPRSFIYIKKRLALTEQTIKRSLKELLNSGIIKINNKGNILLDSNFILPKIEFNAYEAKLHNWKRALYQATQYYGFSHYSSVIMPDKYINPALENIEFFKGNGIGLIGVNNNGKRKVYLRPIKNQPRRKAFYLVGLGKVMQAYLNMM